ncbi:hypothetical protein C8Q74DRAFT_1279667 [Fomes fomentarius]|nr:hypothetical protein C8Q74DRAFT_1279667 [Fomes fomentarius]
MALAYETTLFALTLIKLLFWLLSPARLHGPSIVGILLFSCACVERPHRQEAQNRALYGIALVKMPGLPCPIESQKVCYRT